MSSLDDSSSNSNNFGGVHDVNVNDLDEHLHPLLTPSILDVLFDCLELDDAIAFRQVCLTWNRVFGSKINPFLYKPIFHNLLKYLCKKSLLQCRLVCSRWNDAIVDSFRWTRENIDRKGKENDMFFNEYFNNPRPVNEENFQRFHNKFRELMPLPLPLAFRHFTASLTVTMNGPHTLEFFRVYGHYIKYLHWNRPIWTFEDLRRILFELCPNIEWFKLSCGMLPVVMLEAPNNNNLLHVDSDNYSSLPNLKFLTLDVNFLDFDWNPAPFTEEFIAQLLRSCPNLEILRGGIEPWHRRGAVVDIISRYEGITLNRLRKIEPFIVPSFSQLQNLRSRQLQLVSVGLWINYEDVTVEALHGFIRSLKDTLTSLHIVFFKQAAAHEFPNAGDLQKLNHLHLEYFKGPLDFLEEIKSLEILNLQWADFSIQHKFKDYFSIKSLLPGLKQLNIRH